MLKGVRLSCKEIPGGYVFWQDDLTGVLNTINELHSINETLSEQKDIAKEELRINQECSRLKEVNRLYGLMQQETAGQLMQMRKLTNELEGVDTIEAQQRILRRLVLIGAYFKRRNNLLFLAESGTTIHSDELKLCLQESLHTMRYVPTVCRLSFSAFMPMRAVTTLYDLVENVLEQALEQITSCAILVEEDEASYRLIMSVQLKEEGNTPVFHPVFQVETEDDGAWVLSASVLKGGAQE